MQIRTDLSTARALAPVMVLCLTAAAAGHSADPGLLALRVPDVPVVTQDGAHLSFYRDLVAGKVVAINFIFTSCTTVCPPLGVKFKAIQRLLGDRSGKDVFLISVSVDPVNDTPARLKDWSAKFGARPGWTLVTGRKQDIDELLRALNSSSASPDAHTTMVLIGNAAAGTWTRAYGFAPAGTLVKSIEKALAAGGATVAGAGGSR
jgi:protein SCO1/2